MNKTEDTQRVHISSKPIQYPPNICYPKSERMNSSKYFFWDTSKKVGQRDTVPYNKSYIPIGLTYEY